MTRGKSECCANAAPPSQVKPQDRCTPPSSHAHAPSLTLEKRAGAPGAAGDTWPRVPWTRPLRPGARWCPPCPACAGGSGRGHALKAVESSVGEGGAQPGTVPCRGGTEPRGQAARQGRSMQADGTDLREASDPEEAEGCWAVASGKGKEHGQRASGRKLLGPGGRAEWSICCRFWLDQVWAARGGAPTRGGDQSARPVTGL